VRKSYLVLASNSPRRRDLLALGAWTFQIQPADVDESRLPGEAPAAYVLRLAEEKARACAESAEAGQIMVGADTAVVDGDDILGKPANKTEAAQMLRQLRGRVHQVYTGIALFRIPDGKTITDLCVTSVPMRTYSDEEIDGYAATGDPLDKAGAYAIQNAAFHPVERMAGCYASVMGLPLCHLTRSLRKLGLEPESDISVECQAALKYECPVTEAILRGELAG
jgi:septum formation protein